MSQDAEQPARETFPEVGSPRESYVGPLRLCMRDGVRRAEPDDAALIAAIQVLSWEVFGSQTAYVARPAHDPERLIETWRKRLEQPASTRTWLAVRGGEPAGYVSVGPLRAAEDASVAEVYSAHVHPRYWYSSIPDNLVHAAVDSLAQQGHSRLCIWVFSEARELGDWLESAGFVAGERRVATSLDAALTQYTLRLR